MFETAGVMADLRNWLSLHARRCYSAGADYHFSSLRALKKSELKSAEGDSDF
jgi:hypothetical protein